MSKKTNHSQDDIKNMVEAKGFTYIEGSQINTNSQHLVRCNSCNMIEKKSSMWAVSEKMCRFSPCNKKGIPTMLYMQTIATDNDVTVAHPTLNVDLYNKEAISVTDKLIWKKDEEVMTQSFEEVRKRALSSKKGTFFIADKNRRSPVKDKMTLKNIEILCKQKNLKVKELQTTTQEKSVFLHIPCNKEFFLTHYQLENFKDTQCIVCNPLDEKVTIKFNSYLKKRNMQFTGILKPLPNSKNVDKQQKISIECLICGHTNKAIIYDKVKYKGFTYCENDSCSNSRNPKDITNQSLEYYLELFKKYHFNSMAEVQQGFPNAAQYIQTDKNMQDTIVEVFGFKTNELTKKFTDDELISALEIAYENGFQKKDVLINSLPNEIKKFIKINNKNNEFQIKLHLFLENIGVVLLKNVNIDSLEDALNYIEKYTIKSWSELLNQHGSVSSKIIELNLKDDVFKIKDWIKLPNYSNLTDQELLNEVTKICTDDTNGIGTITDLRDISYGLVVHLKKRGLVEKVIQVHNFPKKMNWKEYTQQEVIKYINDKKYFSLSDIHIEESGLYKHCSKNDWLRDIERECKLGNFRGLDKQSYSSKVELIIANLLYLNKIEYQAHANVFKGKKGGQSTADFYLTQYDSYIEVWGLNKNEDAQTTNMPDYLDVREYKEEQYIKNHLELCSIEGNLYYKSIIIDDVKHTHKLEGYIAHAINELNKHKVQITNNENLIDQIRSSIKQYL